MLLRPLLLSRRFAPAFACISVCLLLVSCFIRFLFIDPLPSCAYGLHVVICAHFMLIYKYIQIHGICRVFVCICSFCLLPLFTRSMSNSLVRSRPRGLRVMTHALNVRLPFAIRCSWSLRDLCALLALASCFDLLSSLYCDPSTYVRLSLAFMCHGLFIIIHAPDVRLLHAFMC